MISRLNLNLIAILDKTTQISHERFYRVIFHSTLECFSNLYLFWDKLNTMKNNTLLKLLFKIAGAPTPTQLIRNHQSLQNNELQKNNVLLFSLNDGSFSEQIHSALLESGIVVRLDTSSTINALVLNVCGLKNLSDFNTLYRVASKSVTKLNKNARIVIISDAGETLHSVTTTTEQSTNVLEASIIPALEGFMRSLSKEVGHLGTTVNLIHVKKEGIKRMPNVLRFVLSKRSAFISGQTLTITHHKKNASPTTYNAPLSGKRMIVTGAGRGIGLAITNALAREGAQVIGIDMPNNPSLHAQMAQAGGLALELDITDNNATKTLCDFLHSNTGAVNGIIHNAGITRDKTIKNMSDSQWQSVLNVNLIAPVTLTQALLDQNLILNGGRIIGLSSISGIAGNAGQTNYALTKGGLAGYVAGLADELANKGITANTIAPGFIETEMTAKIPFMVRTVGRLFNALKQGGLPEDVAELVVFLASANSAGITGHNIRVCGHNLLGK